MDEPDIDPGALHLLVDVSPVRLVEILLVPVTPIIEATIQPRIGPVRDGISIQPLFRQSRFVAANGGGGNAELLGQGMVALQCRQDLTTQQFQV